MGSLSDDIVKYKKGEMSPKEMHALEKRALADPFLAEALEGLEGVSANDLTDDILRLNGNFTRKRTLFTPLRIAAGVCLLLGSAFFIYQLVPRGETLALKAEKPKTEKGNAASDRDGDDAPTTSKDKNAGDGTVVPQNEKQEPKGESRARESDKPGPSLKHEEQPPAKVPLSEPKTEIPETESTTPTQTPALDLAAQEQKAKAEDAEDRKAKEIAGLEQQAAGAKAISSERKKSAFVASEAQRSAAPMVKIETSKSISGRVVSAEDGSPLPGVNVILKGTSLGTVTDYNGDYKISADPGNRSLVFSFIGLQVQEIDASGRDKIDVQMKEDASQLSEVVVTALGVTKDDQDEPVIRWAEPEGGRKAYDNYLESNVRYPEEAIKNKVKGKAGIEFTVGTDGSLSDFRVIKKLGYGCEDEIIRLVRSGPRWNPTTEDNKPIESTVRVRLRFDPAKTGR